MPPIITKHESRPIKEDLLKRYFDLCLQIKEK